MATTRYVLIFLALAVLPLAILSGCGFEEKKTATGETGTQAAAVPPRKTDAIVFVRNSEIWAVNPNNMEERQVTHDGISKVWPRLSPDGNTVVYQVSGNDDESDGIYTVPLAEDGGPPEQLHDSGYTPCWSTDGKTIAFVKRTSLPDGSAVDDIATIKADTPGETEQVLTDHSGISDMGGKLAIQHLEYSPDGGTYIYFMRGRRSDSRWLARYKVATGNEENVSNPPGSMPEALADGGFSLFNVSQMEGRRALVSRGDLNQGNYQSGFKLYIRFLEPSLEDSLMEETPGSINPSLKPDNTRFVYENGGVLYKHNLAGGPGIERITEGSMPDWGASAVGPGFGADDGTRTGTTVTTQTTRTTETTMTSGGDVDTGGGGVIAGEYIRNGDFTAGLDNWNIVDIKKKGTNNASVAEDPEYGKVLVLSRSNSLNDGGLIGIEQSLDANVSRLDGLELKLVAAIDGQTLASDGWYGGESPVFVSIDYTTASGGSGNWTHGFLLNGSTINYPDRDQTIPGIEWYSYSSGNLLALIPDATTIDKVTVGGNGWDLLSRVAEVSLKGS